MMGENPEREYQCKLCDKIFSSGRVLGGHMRRHMAKNLLEREPPLGSEDGSEEARRLGYCLRENPKKSWKFSGPMENVQENPCSVCSKRFRSSRALFGHMKIHLRKDDESGDRCEEALGKGSGLMKSWWDRARPMLDRERLNMSLSSEDRYVGLSKTKGDLLLSVLFDDKAMHTTRRKRTPRFSYDVDERTKGVLVSVPNGISFRSEAEQDLENEAAVLLMMISRGEVNFNFSGFGIEPFRKSLAPNFFDVEKLRMTEASEYNKSHSRGYARMERKGVELEVPAGMLRGAREVEHRKPKAARSREEPMYEAAMMDSDLMRVAGSDLTERAELVLNSYRDKVSAEESQASGEPGEENKYRSRDAESYKQDAPVDASWGIEGNRGCNELESIKDYSEKATRYVCSICHKDFSSGQALGGHKKAHYAKNPEPNAEMPTSAATQQKLADMTNMVDLYPLSTVWTKIEKT